MANTGTEDASNNFKQSGNQGALHIYIITLLVFLFVIKYAGKRRAKSGHAPYTDTLPYLQFIPFLRLPILESIIFWYKARTEGLGIVDSYARKLGRICKIYAGFKTVIAVSDPDIIQKLLNSSSPGHLHKSQFPYTQLFTRLLKDGLLVSNVNTWSHHRKVLAPAFKYKSFTTYFKFINEEAKILARSACDEGSKTNDGVINNHIMKKIINHHIIRIVTHIIMGSESFNFSDEERSLFHQSYTRFKDISAKRFQRPEQMIPLIWWLHPNKKVLDRDVDSLVEISCQIAKSYRTNITVNEKVNLAKSNSNNFRENTSSEDQIDNKAFECLVELMIKSGLSNKEITDEVATFLVVGHETVKVALDMLIFHLAGNEKHQKKCRAEVDKLFNSKRTGKAGDLSLDDFSKLKYLELCILESMRLTPTVPLFSRDLQEPLLIDDNNVIPADEMVVVIPWVLHRNPEYYPDPEKFDPSRFLPENVKQRHPYSFIPFSMGMRNCIGWKIALLEIKVIMAWILRHFEMHTTDGPNDVKLFFEMMLTPERPHNVTFTKRSVQDL